MTTFRVRDGQPERHLLFWLENWSDGVAIKASDGLKVQVIGIITPDQGLTRAALSPTALPEIPREPDTKYIAMVDA